MAAVLGIALLHFLVAWCSGSNLVSIRSANIHPLFLDLRTIKNALALRRRQAVPVDSGQVAAIFLFFAWLMFFLWPTAGIFAGTHGLKYAVLASVLGLGYLSAGAVPAATIPALWLAWAFIAGIFSALSYTVYMHELSFGDGTYVARPFFFALTFGLAYLAGVRAASNTTLTRTLRKLVFALLLLQVLIAVTQMFGLEMAAAIYSADKVSPFGRLLRITGTLGNPNLFAYHVLLAITFLAAHSTSKPRAFSWLAFGFLLILMSGSRTVLILYVPVILAVVRMKARGSFSALMKMLLPMMAILLLGGYLVFMLFTEYFPYVGELVSLIGAGEILGFRAFALRTAHWINIWAELVSGSLGQWLFGAYDGRVFRGAVDNDWLYALWRHGLIGVVSTLAWYLLAVFTTSRIRCAATRKLLFVWLAVIAVFSLMFESVSGWWIPFVVMLVMGLYLGAGSGELASGTGFATKGTDKEGATSQ
ncbi:MAG: hypothetical protein JJT88_17825 [Gammaproteobacteria bacterium]|nr:hypothetical protein [Gammaproteobacteria bacterium]